MSASFEEFVRAVFEHECVRHAEQKWYWHPEFNDAWAALGLSDELVVKYVTQLFHEPAVLKPYSLDQVGEAIWFLVGESSPAAIGHAIAQPGVAIEKRIACIHAISEFFSKFVVPAAPGSANEKDDEFHVACYMWWDIFPTWGGMHPHAQVLDQFEREVGQWYKDIAARDMKQIGEPEIHIACLDSMEQVLQLPTELCQLSALHGLNHWHLHHGERVEQIIDAYLANASTPTARVREYAAQARIGGCQ